MSRAREGRARRINKLRSRITSTSDDHFQKCTVPGCGRPTTRALRKGLASTLCRKHVLHRQRHGSPWCPAPSAVALKPYVQAAQAFIKANRGEPLVSAAIAGLRGLMEAAGPVVIGPRLRGLPPDKRARIALARLRDASVKPELLLARALAVHALIEEAPQVCHRIKEWRIVAIAKAVHRLASGYHRVWEFTEDNGHIQRTELHVYPRSTGRVLRYLGAWVEQPVEWVIERHLADVVALKVKRYGPHAAIADPLRFAAAADHQVLR